MTTGQAVLTNQCCNHFGVRFTDQLLEKNSAQNIVLLLLFKFIFLPEKIRPALDHKILITLSAENLLKSNVSLGNIERRSVESPKKLNITS